MTDTSPSRALRPLGGTELMVSPIAWGMWRFSGDDVNAARGRVEAALEAGLSFMDTADIYGPDNGEAFGGSERLLGRVFAEAPGLRDKIVLATKAGIEMGVPYNSSADYLVAACEASLKRMGVERVELFQIHRPDTLAHPAEVAGALERAARRRQDRGGRSLQLHAGAGVGPARAHDLSPRQCSAGILRRLHRPAL